MELPDRLHQVTSQFVMCVCVLTNYKQSFQVLFFFATSWLNLSELEIACAHAVFFKVNPRSNTALPSMACSFVVCMQTRQLFVHDSWQIFPRQAWQVVLEKVENLFGGKKGGKRANDDAVEWLFTFGMISRGSRELQVQARIHFDGEWMCATRWSHLNL